MSLDSEIKSRELALGSLNPQQLTSRLRRGGGGLLDALATQKILSQKEAFKRDFAMQMENSPKTIAQKNEEKLMADAMPSQTDVVQGLAGVLRNKQKRQNANAKTLAGIDPRKLKALVKRGIPGAPVPRVQKAAQGGIVGFNEGMTVPNIDTTNDPTFLREKKGLPYSPYFGVANISLLPGMVGPSANDVADIQSEFVAEFGTKAYEYLKNNPAEAIALGVTAIPGVGLAFKLGKGAVDLIGKFVSGGAKLLKNYPKTSAVAGAAGAFAGQDAINPLLEDPVKTMKSAGEFALDVGKGITTLPKTAYEGTRDLLGIESPGLFTPSANPASKTSPGDTTTTDAPTQEYYGPPGFQNIIEPQTVTEKKSVPEVTGDETPAQRREKEAIVDSRLDDLTSKLARYATGKGGPGSYAMASKAEDKFVFDQKLKLQSMRFKEMELRARFELNNIRRDQLTQNFFLSQVDTLNKNILSGIEAYQKSPYYQMESLKLSPLYTALQKELGKKKPDQNEIDKIQNEINAVEKSLKVGRDEIIGGFVAEKKALMDKFKDLYPGATPYTETKDDFNLEDKRTLGR
tara:strand:+ start:425 stop:2143 length:1719 start_codon:yes stop_codon:yes gene_type:complete